MNRQMTWLIVSVLFTLMVIAACASHTVAQNTFPTPSGNVGIGTTSPPNMLTITDGATPYSAGPTDLFQLKRNASNGSTSPNNGVSMVLGNNSNAFRIKYGGTSDRLGFLDGGDVERLSILNGGNVGIGTASPNRTLTVEGNSGLDVRSSTGYFVNLNYAYSSSVASLYALNSSGGVAPLIINPEGGNVGIGTTSPGQLLSINSPAATNSAMALSVNATTYGIWGTAGETDSLISGSVLGDSVFRSQGKNFLFSTDSGGSAQLYLKNGGNVGIGMTNPGAYKLNVNGSTNVTGNLNITAGADGPGNIVAQGTIFAKYQDVAEWVPSSEQLTSGTVVVLDSTKSNQVISSTVSYDTRVAGVISAQPGIALGEKSDSKVLVATTGRVKVKVDASKGAIHIGDLLVTSDVPGVAMKSEAVNLGGVQFHRPGTLIGKALDPLEKGSGEILVLLSLQ